MKNVYHEFPRQNYVEVKFFKNAPKAHVNSFHEEAVRAFTERNQELLALFAPQPLASFSVASPSLPPAPACEEEDARVFSEKLAQMAASAFDFERKLGEVSARREYLQPEELWEMLNRTKEVHAHPFFNAHSAYFSNREAPDVVELAAEECPAEPPEDAKLLPL
mgnify:CR=1 FL=1